MYFKKQRKRKRFICFLYWLQDFPNKIMVCFQIPNMRLVCANKPYSADPPYPLCRWLHLHCCIFQSSTAGGERPKRGVQELFNLLWGWRGVNQWFNYLIWPCDTHLVNTFSLSRLSSPPSRSTPLNLFSTLLLSQRSIARWLLFL